MLHRVEVDVIHVSRVIAIIVDRVFPVAALPNAEFAFAKSGSQYPIAIGQRSGERGFDSSPAVGEVAVAQGKGPQAMHMVRQHDPGVDVKGRLPAHGAHCFAKRVDLRHQQAGAAVAQVHREEIGGTRDPIASVIRHRASMPEDWPLGRAQGASAAYRPHQWRVARRSTRPTLARFREANRLPELLIYGLGLSDSPCIKGGSVLVQSQKAEVPPKFPYTRQAARSGIEWSP